MSKRRNLWPILIFQLTLITFIMLIGAAFIFFNHDADDTILGKVLLGFGNLLLGAGTSLAAWLIVKLSWLLLRPEENISIGDIKEVVEGERSRPIFIKRADAEPHYYNSAYDCAKEIWSSGRALTSIIKQLFDPKDKKDKKKVLLNNMKKRPMSIKLLLLSPDSCYSNAANLDPKNKDDILGNLNMVYDYCQKIINVIKNNQIKISPKDKLFISAIQNTSLLEIRLTKLPLNSTLFYYHDESSNGRILAGPLYNGITGLISEAYVISESSMHRIFHNHISNFDKTWCQEESSTFLRIKHNNSHSSLELTPHLAMNKQDISFTWPL